MNFDTAIRRSDALVGDASRQRVLRNTYWLLALSLVRANTTASTVEQRFFRVEEEDKRQALKQLLREHQVTQAFVFVNSKLGCARLARALERDGLRVAALHGDKSQDERLKALNAFKQGQVDLLVCTDVAARGLDIKDVPAVFNVDIPFNAEDYVHRIGRTGRAGASGLAVSFVSAKDARLLAEIEKLIGRKVEVEPLDIDARCDAACARPRRNTCPRRGGNRNLQGQDGSPRTPQLHDQLDLSEWVQRGETGAVNAAVRAGADACERVGDGLVAAHIIARVHSEVEGILPTAPSV